MLNEPHRPNSLFCLCFECQKRIDERMMRMMRKKDAEKDGVYSLLDSNCNNERKQVNEKIDSRHL